MYGCVTRWWTKVPWHVPLTINRGADGCLLLTRGRLISRGRLGGSRITASAHATPRPGLAQVLEGLEPDGPGKGSAIMPGQEAARKAGTRGKAEFLPLRQSPQTPAEQSGAGVLGDRLDSAGPTGFAPMELGCDIPAHICCPNVPGCCQRRQFGAASVLAWYAGIPAFVIRTGKKTANQWRQEDRSCCPATEYDCK